jgi:ergothioneine biosynthesis protein EgtB
MLSREGSQTHQQTTVDSKEKADLLLKRYQEIRSFTGKLCEPLATEDYVIQTMPDVSPTKWHLAHTSWFFETFILTPAFPDYKSPSPQFAYLFNSYYNTVGDKHHRPHRGLLSRPTVNEVFGYRRHVDTHMSELASRLDDKSLAELALTLEIGLQHEQQHQELILTDIKHVFSMNPMRPVYRERIGTSNRAAVPPLKWCAYEEGLHWIGHGAEGFAFDNESPRHRVFVKAYEVGTASTKPL